MTKLRVLIAWQLYYLIYYAWDLLKIMTRLEKKKKKYKSLYVIVINQLPRFVCIIEGGVLLYCIQSEGLVDNYFLAHYFNKHVFSPQELNVCPCPQELYNSKHMDMDMNPTRRVCITYTVPCIS